jgi:hypothetical protein
MGNYFSLGDQGIHFDDVPLLILEQIANFLPLIDVLSFRLVSRNFYQAAEFPHFNQLSSFNCMGMFQRCTFASKFFADLSFQNIDESQRHHLTNFLFGKVFVDNCSSDRLSMMVDDSRNHFVCHQQFIIGNLLIFITNNYHLGNNSIIELNTKTQKLKISSCEQEKYVEQCLERYFNCVYPKPTFFPNSLSFCCFVDNSAGKLYTIDYQNYTIHKSIFDFQGNELDKYVSSHVRLNFFFNGGLCLSQHSGNPLSFKGIGWSILVMWMQNNVNILIQSFGEFTLDAVSSYMLPFNERVYFMLNMGKKSHLLSISYRDVYSVRLHSIFETNPLENYSYELLDCETLFTGKNKLQRIDPVGKENSPFEHWFAIQRIKFVKN